MKTSIIISTVAVVSLMITFAESPMNRDSQFNKETLYDKISYIPAKSITIPSEFEFSAYAKEVDAAKTKVNINKDFSYLKFNVSDFSDAENMGTNADADNSFEYLKFDSNNYDKNYDLTSTESIERTANEFDYLKFDANNYNATDKVEAIETPINEFDYLKFDVNNYTATDNVEIFETPINEFDYLKFDVNKYSSTDLSSGQNVELPVAER